MGRKTLSLGLYIATLSILFSLFGSIFLNTAPVAKAQTDGSLAQYQAWFPGAWSDGHKSALSINPAGSKTIKPTVSVMSGNPPSVTRPDIRFELFGYFGAGTTNETNADFFVFKATRLDTKAALPNLYLIVSDEFSGGSAYMVYSPATTASGIGKNHETISFDGTNTGVPTFDRQILDEDDIERLFRFTFNAPKDKKNTCAGKAPADLVVTGPTSPQKERLVSADLATKAIDLNGNCINLTDGWLKSWGITDTSSNPIDANGPCSPAEIIKTGTGMFSRVIACAFQSVVTGIVKPFSGWISDAVSFSQNCLIHELANRKCDTRATTGTPYPNGEMSPYLAGWSAMRSLVNVVVLIALLAIAFANIFHLNINTYAAKKALPGLVIGVIGANASILIIRFILDVANGLGQLAVDIGTAGTLGPSTSSGRVVDLVNEMVRTLTNPVASVLDSTSGLVLFGATGFILIAMIIVSIFVIVFLGYLLFAFLRRIIMILGLTIVSPLAFISYGVPGFQQWFGKWWDQFIRNAFVWPLLLLSIGLYIPISKAIAPGLTLTNADFTRNFINLIMLYAAAWAIVRLPGLITKGAIDLEKAAKSAFGVAQTAPQASMRLGSAALDWKEKSIKDKDAQNRFKATRGALFNNWATGKLRKAAVIANNPSTYTDAFKKRLELDEKARKKESYFIQTGDAITGSEAVNLLANKVGAKVKPLSGVAGKISRGLNRGLTGTIGGAAAEVDSTYGLAKETNQGASRREVMAWYFGGIEDYLTENDTELRNLAKDSEGKYINKGAINSLTGEINKEKLASFAAKDSGDKEKLRVLAALIRKTNSDPAFMSKLLTAKSAEKILDAGSKLDGDDMGYGYDNSQLANSVFSFQAVSRARKNDPDPELIKSVAFRNKVPGETTATAAGGAAPLGTPIDMNEPIVPLDYTPGTGAVNVQGEVINLIGADEMANKTAGIVSQLDQADAQKVRASADEWLARLDSHFANGTQDSDEAQELIAEIRDGTRGNINETSAEATHQVLSTVHKLVSDGQYGPSATPSSLATAIASAQQNQPQIQQALNQLNTTVTEFAEKNLELLEKEPLKFAEETAKQLEPGLAAVAIAAGRSLTPQEIKRQATVNANLIGEQLKQKGPNSLRGDIRSTLGQAARAMGAHTLTPPQVNTTVRIEAPAGGPPVVNQTTVQQSFTQAAATSPIVSAAPEAAANFQPPVAPAVPVEPIAPTQPATPSEPPVATQEPIPTDQPPTPPSAT